MPACCATSRPNVGGHHLPRRSLRRHLVPDARPTLTTSASSRHTALPEPIARTLTGPDRRPALPSVLQPARETPRRQDRAHRTLEDTAKGPRRSNHADNKATTTPAFLAGCGCELTTAGPCDPEAARARSRASTRGHLLRGMCLPAPAIAGTIDTHPAEPVSRRVKPTPQCAPRPTCTWTEIDEHGPTGATSCAGQRLECPAGPRRPGRVGIARRCRRPPDSL